MIKYFEDNMRILSESVESIDEKAYNRLVDECSDVLSLGHKIIISGLGKNVPVCDKFVGTMLSLGLNAGFMHTNSAVHGDLGLVSDGDIVIVLTKSGETIESIYLVEQLKKRNVNIWLLTFEKESTLTKEIKDNCLILDLKHEGDIWNIAPCNSTTINLIVVQGIAWALAKKQGCDLKTFKANHPGGHIGLVLKSDG